MYNNSKINYKLKGKLVNFLKKLSVSKPIKKFLMDITYGIMASKSTLLSNISRSLNEDITLKKTIERLSNHLKNDSLEDVYDEILTKQNIVFNKDTIIAIDSGDLCKNYAKTFECIDKVLDGSNKKEFKMGYRTIDITALNDDSTLPIPIYSQIVTSLEEGYKSDNKILLDGINQVISKYGKNGTYVLDRGYDSEQMFNFFIERQMNFVIRLKSNRDIINIKTMKEKNVLKYAKGIKLKDKYQYIDNQGITRSAAVGYREIKIPACGETKLYLVVIKSTEFKKSHPMMLLTTIKPTMKMYTKIINKMYMQRWRIEEYFRFKKTELRFEEEMVRSLRSIRNINIILNLIIVFIGEIGSNKEMLLHCELFHISKTIRKKEEINFILYAIYRGIKKVFENSRKGIRELYQNKTCNSQQMILPEVACLL